MKGGKDVAFGLGLCTALVAALLAAAAVSRADPPPPPSKTAAQGTFGELLEVRLVEVPVVVTDVHGRPVPGLGRDEFELLVDGRPVPIERFEALAGESNPEAAGGAAAEEPGEEASPRDGHRAFLVFVDDGETGPRRRTALLAALAADLGQLAPGDRVAVVRWDGTSLEVVVDWTGSHDEVRRALEGLERASSGALRRRRELEAVGDPRMLLKRLAERIRGAAEAAAASLAGMGSPGGRRILVLVSGGWPYDFERFVSPRYQAIAHRYGGEQLLAPLVETANLLGYTVYPLAAESASRLPPRLSAARGRLPAPPASHGADRWAVQRDSLEVMAEHTGGKVIPFFAALEGGWSSLLGEVGASYLLAFSPAWQRDGRRHAIEVRVGRPGLSARHRSGFRDVSRQGWATVEAQAALLLGRGAELAVATGKPRPVRRGIVELPVAVTLPLDLAVAVPGRPWAADFELVVESIDRQGRRSELRRLPIRVAASDLGRLQGRGAVYEMRVLLRRKTRRLVLSLFDSATGVRRTTSLDLDLDAGGG